ncbi:hypothetical protein KQI76_00345 [Amphibacillus sp. MSJ-3]|uniref:LiaI-LiaF-like domain-containing protein n=1 Tax=Amphibacillus sp. MSJ-3 TaxID=2841505 RepID=UPI001C0F2FF4|nr:DUF5668 domain-containing protein [Amphibacillus sp. MSJ-3]MBU5593608.1 hypothetical protein [Amphibacillus sp. MSJ-3]
MRKQNYLTAYILIGVGLYFLLQQWQIPLLENFTTWPTLLMILGFSLLIHGYLSRDHDKLFPGVVLLGIGIHFHAISIYPNWIDHWSVYAIIIGLAFLIRYQKTKVGLYPGLILLLTGLFVLLSLTNSQFSQSVNQLLRVLENYWPVSLIIFGVYLLIKKR